MCNSPPVETLQPSAPSQPDIDLKRLQKNYDALVRSQEIYYPLAYRFTSRLGSGRQGIVYQALRQGARGCITQHAIKIHDPSIYPSTEKYWTDMGRIASQISTLQKVHSPQLVSRDIYEEVNGIGYTQMEVVEGIDIHSLIQRDHSTLVKSRSTAEEWDYFNEVIFNPYGIQPGVALYIMRQALRGLEALHNAGFLHSDIKPANMMIDRLGLVKLIDYGRAVRVDEENTFLMGTPLYMAPEIHRQQGASIQSDIYSVGLVGLELLCNEPLVAMSVLDETKLLDCKDRLVDILPNVLPEAVRKNEYLIEMFCKFLHRDPAQRYASAAEAESGPDGLNQIHKQLAMAGKDTEYDRELEKYVGKVLGGFTPPVDVVEELIG
ncbi:MAG: serine/threonine protein kinase [Kiritimatiellales bacterium]|nr:serine/threonine protein kinase [Kiritimatiellales bacterium]MCF7864581.1 serine/threonine protein kinase [Kiritimatiellales bacterium]